MYEPVLPYGDETLLPEVEAAKYLGVQPVTLKKWRHLKVGPEYITVGPGGEYSRGVRYWIRTGTGSADPWVVAEWQPDWQGAAAGG
jgi:hypothetical protein